jgi:phosphomevalonate kinase
LLLDLSAETDREPDVVDTSQAIIHKLTFAVQSRNGGFGEGFLMRVAA